MIRTIQVSHTIDGKTRVTVTLRRGKHSVRWSVKSFTASLTQATMTCCAEAQTAFDAIVKCDPDD